MIAVILHSSPTFEAVNYNERKVAKGDATLLAIENFSYLDATKDYTATNLQQYLINYSKRNERIKKPQFHVSFSCKGTEMSHDEIVKFSRQWLTNMGYNDPKQPLLIYSHNDTNNNHIHIITSRVAPDGKKIAHSHERVRSKEIVDNLLGVDTRTEMDAAIKASLIYRFSTVSQWQAVLEASGYDVKQDNEVLKIERNGAYKEIIPVRDIENLLKTDYEKKKKRQRFWALLNKFREISTDKEELKLHLKQKFGIDIVFIGSKDAPRGYFLVDHKDKEVYKGSNVMKIKDLLHFEKKEEKMKRFDAWLDMMFQENNNLTSRDLNTHLLKYYGARLKDGKVYFINRSVGLKPYMQEALKRNNKIAWAKTFSYTTEEEKTTLCKIFNLRQNDLVSGGSTNDSGRKAELIHLMTTLSRNVPGIENFRNILEKENPQLRLVHYQNKIFCIDMENRCIICLNDNGIHLRLIDNNFQMEERHRNNIMPTRQMKSRGSSSSNRENEVGTTSRYDDIDDAKKLKR